MFLIMFGIIRFLALTPLISGMFLTDRKIYAQQLSVRGGICLGTKKLGKQNQNYGNLYPNFSIRSFIPLEIIVETYRDAIENCFRTVP